MKKIIALMLVIMLTALSVIFVGCDKNKPIDAGEANNGGEQTTEETTSSVVNKELSSDAAEAYDQIRKLILEKATQYCMDFKMTEADEFVRVVRKAAQNGDYVMIDQGVGLTEIYVMDNVGYVKSPDVDGFVASSDSEAVGSLKQTIKETEQFNDISFPDDINEDVVVDVTDSTLGGVKITFTDKDNSNNKYVVETDSKVYEITEDGEVIGSGITKIKITFVAADTNGGTTTLDCVYTEINGKITLKSPL